MSEMLPHVDEIIRPFSTPAIFVLELLSSEDWNTEAVLLVERHTKYCRCENQVSEASLEFKYRVITPGLNTSYPDEGEFSASYDASYDGHPHVRLTSNFVNHGGYYIVEQEELRGHGIGTFFMNEIVHWVQQWPEAQVIPISLLSSDAAHGNKHRRNRFYENFGLIFEYDAHQASGTSHPIKAGGLIPLSIAKQDALNKKIGWHLLDDYLAVLDNNNKSLKLKLKGLMNEQKTSINDWLQAYQRPFRWALKVSISKLWGAIGW